MGDYEPTERALNFMAENDSSPVVGASVKEGGGGGAQYWLDDGKSRSLSAEDLRSMPEGYPRWKF